MNVTNIYQQLHILGYVGLAMLLGGIIGIEREIAHKPAGLRTHMMVAGAAALLVALAEIIIRHFDVTLEHAAVRPDPLRIMGAVITGVSFLGAGTIIRHRSDEQVEGLTTAASLLFVAGVGVTVALSQLVLAVGVTILVWLTLRVFGSIWRWSGLS